MHQFLPMVPQAPMVPQGGSVEDRWKKLEWLHIESNEDKLV